MVHGVVTPEEMGGLYAGADSLVLTSHDEGYATVVAEALRAGLPVLAWSVGNIPNLLTDGEEGILLPRGDLERLRDSIRRLAGDGALRSEMASKASIRGSALPTWEQSGDLFFATLDRLLPPV
jgi:glycosyltransferase involved in cell wall biosynthesis